MSTSGNRSGSPRAPWILPVLLAIIIAAIIVLFVFGSRIRTALSSPTATPVVKTVVVTNTPGTPTATPGGPTSTPGGAGAGFPAGAEPTATSSTSAGIVTPLPNATPVPTVAGLQLGMITRPQSYVTATQAKVNSGTPGYAFYRDPRTVVQYNLPHFGFTQGFTIVAPNPSPTPTPLAGPSGHPEVKFVVEYRGKVYTVYVVQPGTSGPKGIWAIVTILPGRR